MYNGGWWYNKCHTVKLNGLYWNLPQALNTSILGSGLTWYCSKGHEYSFKRVEILIAIDTNAIARLLS